MAWEALKRKGYHRWAFSVEDTGPGIQRGAVALLAQAIEESTVEAQAIEQAPDDLTKSSPQIEASSTISSQVGLGLISQQPGEGVGLAIVKRLCDLLEATLELKTDFDRGSVFRVVLPRHYDVG